MFKNEKNHGILQIEISNASNSINRNVVLHNMNIFCPKFSTFVYNCYQIPARLLFASRKEIQSNKGITQGDPVAMGMYATGVFPLLRLNETSSEMNETGAGKLQELQSWWDSIVSYGPNIGYCPKATLSGDDCVSTIFTSSFLSLSSDSAYVLSRTFHLPYLTLVFIFYILKHPSMSCCLK